MADFQVSSGRSYPLGASVTETGVNFAIFSANAEKVELCLFDEKGEQEITRIALPEFTDEVWHGHIAGLKAGTVYGYRVHGPFEPHNGHRFNANKLLLDPYAKKLKGEFIRHNSHLAYDEACPQKDLTLDQTDNAPYLPKAVVVEDLAPCTTHPQVRRRDTVIYELHVKGFTKQRENLAEKLRGTFAGLAAKDTLEYLTALGVTSVELLPAQQFVNEDFVSDKGLSNYWGYNSISFFAPHAAYLHQNDAREFRDMVEAFHSVGIEVIMDVVYNHTAEGDQLGPTYSFKGIDNASYYKLAQQDKRYYENFSGCGNTLNLSHPRVLQLVTDSLRYWVDVMGVDGFRFDLAPILGREQRYFSSHSQFFTALKQDPILAKVKLIAEPWDIGEGGYQLGQFPKSWLEWNDRFRDTCRRFWRGDDHMVAEFAQRLHGSADLFESPSRRPSSSVNFITSHDGFTLADLVSFNEPHNHANGESNNDGHRSNFSFNFGVEGTAENSTVKKLRARQKRNLLTALFIAQGTPMLLAGDEVGNGQRGNNNAYCQDNEISWIDWQQPESAQELAFVKALIQLRREHPLLNRTNYQHGDQVSSVTGLPDISWRNCSGQPMQEHDWHDGALRCFAMLLAQTDSEKMVDAADDALMIIFNAHPCEIHYQLPQLNGYWQKLIDTAHGAEQCSKSSRNIRTTGENLSLNSITAAAHSCVVLSYIHAKG